MSRRGTETRRLASALYVRCSPALASAIDAAARRDGMSAAAWLRRQAADILGAGTAADAQPSPPRHVPREDLAEVSRLVGRVGMMTGALVQTAKRAREESSPLHDEAERVLAEVRRVQRELVDVVSALRSHAR